jgi:hypothetical protein
MRGEGCVRRKDDMNRSILIPHRRSFHHPWRARRRTNDTPWVAVLDFRGPEAGNRLRVPTSESTSESASGSLSLFCAVGASRLRAGDCAFASECKSERHCFYAKPQKRRRSGLIDEPFPRTNHASQLSPPSPGPGLGPERLPGLNSPWTVPRGPESFLFVQVRPCRTQRYFPLYRIVRRGRT